MASRKFYQSYGLVTGSGTSQASGRMAVPDNAVIRHISVLLTAVSTGPCWVKPVFVDQEGAWEALGAGGWIRSDANYIGSETYDWEGHMDTGGFTVPVTISLFYRNDTGSTVAAEQIAIVESP